MLPRGWGHLALQFAIWIGFYVAYQVARGAADRGVGEAFWNGTLVIEAQNSLGLLFEPGAAALRREARAPRHGDVAHVLALAVRGRRDERCSGCTSATTSASPTFRNWLIGANLVGLVGYVLMPTAPPRMFPEWGFTDTLAEHAAVNQSTVAFAANPYAAMPSLHAMDALIVGLVMASLVRDHARPQSLWLAWPAWVCVRRDGDGQPLLARLRRRDRRSPSLTGGVLLRGRLGTIARAAVRDASDGRAAGQPARPGQAGVHRRGARDPAPLDAGRREDEADARTCSRSPGVALCIAGAVLVGFEERNEYLFFWLGGAALRRRLVADILDGALARAAGKGTVFGAFLDSTFDRLGEAAMLTAIGLVFMRDGERARARRDLRRGDRLVPRQLHTREGGGARSARRRRLRLSRSSGS